MSGMNFVFGGTVATAPPPFRLGDPVVCGSDPPSHPILKVKQESPAIADKPARRESLPKIAPIRRAYNVVADDTGLASFV